MRTTLDIEEELLAEVVKLTGEKSKSKAVNKALRDLLYWEAVKDLRAMAGTSVLVDDFDELLTEQRKRDTERLKRAEL